MSNVGEIKDLVSSMNKSSEGYDQKALQIWNLLSPEEKEGLVFMIGRRPPVFDGLVVKDPIRKRLIEMGLVSRTTWHTEMGYTQISFTGYAAYRASNPKTIGVTLPGEKKT